MIPQRSMINAIRSFWCFQYFSLFFSQIFLWFCMLDGVCFYVVSLHRKGLFSYNCGLLCLHHRFSYSGEVFSSFDMLSMHQRSLLKSSVFYSSLLQLLDFLTAIVTPVAIELFGRFFHLISLLRP